MGRNLLPAFCLVLCLILPLSLDAQIFADWTLPGDTYEEVEGRGLTIRSNPGGARVYIDGIEMGRTPVYLNALRPGSYFVRLEREGYQERRFRVFVRSGSVTNVSIEMKAAVGRILLKIQPDRDSPGPDKLLLEPRISVDGTAYPNSALELPVGFRTIAVRAFGWDDVSATLYIENESYRELELNLKPASFKLSNGAVNRLRFNPANAGSLGTTTFSYEVSSSGRGTFTVLDQGGRIVAVRELGLYETWAQSAVWDGRNSGGEILADGTYTLIVKAVSVPWDDSVPLEISLAQEVIIDSTKDIFPLSLASGRSGLLFAPLPAALPALSFQIEGGLTAGYPCGSGGPWKSLPFAAAFRISPIEHLEVSMALNVIPMFTGSIGTGISGGVKWAFLNSGIFGGAAAFNFSWTGKTAVTPFGMPSGFELYVPFKIDLGRFFSIALSPSILWTGDEGFPWEGAPRLLISGGVMMRMTYFFAGLSVRTEFKFTGGGARHPFILTGAELRFFPPPSSFVFSVNGGAWIKNSSAGGFAGFTIGMIH